MPSGGSSAPASSTVVNQTTIPPFLEKAYQGVIDRSTAASQEPYQAYSAQRVADFSPTQQQAQNMTTAGIGSYQPGFNTGVATTAAAATPFDQSTFNQFMDPYQSQVTDEIARLGNRNFTENLLPSVNSQFTGNGMFGASKNAEVLGNAARDTQADITGKQAEYLSQGFQNQMGNYANAENRSLQAGQDQVANAATGQQLQANDINALNTVGAQQTDKQQQLLDTAYNEFLAQRDYPEQQISFASNIAHGIPVTGLTTNTQQNYAQAGNPLASGLGIGGSLYSLLNPTPKKKGGAVKKKRKSATPTLGLGGMH